MFPSRSLLAACALLACMSLAGSRSLKQSGTISDFTYSNNTYLQSVVVISAGTTAESAEACITLCLDDADCTFWSWCPADQTAGCSVPGLNGAAATTVVAKGCVLSYDDINERNSIFAMGGDAVYTAGGKYSPSNVVVSNTTGTNTTVDPNDPASWIDPSGTPEECNGWFSGDQWSGDEIECHMCDNEYQLKCDLDTDLLGDDSVKCEFDLAGLASLSNNAYEFECTVDFSKTPQNQCNWEEIAAKVPSCAVDPVRRIMATWRPDE